MSRKLKTIKNALSTNRRNSHYRYLLSIVALVEVVMILLVSTVAWVETISSIEIESDKWKFDTYTFTRAEIGSGSGFSGNPIDLASYINESGNVHMASASSRDGKEFYFPEIASASSSKFRRGNLNDKNTNYISFSMKVKAVGASAGFYFNTGGPEFKIGNNVVKDNSVRCAISVADNETATPVTNVYSYKADSSEQVVASTDGTASTITAIRSFRDYDKSDESKMLFELNENEEKLITITLWLQDPQKTNEYAGLKLTSSNFQIVTGTVSTVIQFSDRTSGFNDNNSNVDLRKNTWHWVANDDAKMWVRTAAGKNFELTQSATDPTSWSVSIADQNIGSSTGTLTFYRTSSSVTSDPQNAGNNIFNTWTTKLSDASSTGLPIYTAYGTTKSGKEGYGTWKDVSQILLYSDDAETVLPTPAQGNECNATHVTMINTANDNVQMNYNDGFWRAFIPKDSTSNNLKFSFSNGGTSYTIDAVKRDITQDISTYGVTSATTGYWHPPAKVEAKVGTGYTARGSVSVSGGKTGATEVKVTKGTTVNFSAEPKSDEFAFEGWYSDAACTKKVSSLNPLPYSASNTDSTYTLFAKFLNNVRLTTVTKGGTLEATNAAGKVQINDNAAGKTVSAPVENGAGVTIKALLNDSENYAFTGWYDKDGNKLYSENVKELSNITSPLDLYAYFEVKTFVLDAYAMTNGKNNTTGGSVKFEGQTYYVDHANITVAYTDTAKLMYTAKGDDGYDFKGWYKDEACTQLFSSDNVLTIDKTTTQFKFYAKFELRKYEIKAYPVTNGSVGKTGGTVTVSEKGVSPANSNTGNPATIQATHGHKIEFTAVPEDGYAFVGWYTSATGGDCVSENQTYLFPEGDGTGISGAKTLYGCFKKKYTVALTAYTDGVASGTGGTVKAGTDDAGATSKITVLHGDSVQIVAAPTTAYLFTEWKDSNNTSYSYGTNATTTISKVTKDYMINGCFNIKQFPVKAIATTEGVQGSDGGTVQFTSPTTASGASVQVTVNYGGSATFKANVNKNDGYEFKGWYEKSDLSGDPVDTNENYTCNNITAEKTLYAKFVLKQYTVIATAVSNGVSGSGDGGEVVQVINSTEQTPGSTVTLNNVKHGTSITFKAKPVDGATFDGWFSAATGGSRLDDPANESLTWTVTDNKQVYARFTVTDKTTTIYVAPRPGFTSYNLWVYDKTNEGISHNGNTWPGKPLLKDETTGYYKLRFTTSYSGNFYVILSNDGNNKVLDSNNGDKGFLGEYGKTYLISDSTMSEFKPVTVHIGAVSINSSGREQANGFTGGSITVDGTKYTEADDLTYNSGKSFSATATESGNYKFKGWYDNAECTGKAESTDATLSVTLTENKTYYAKFVEESNTRTIYFTNSANHKWTEDNIYCYAWSVSDGDNGAWPGKKMTKVKTNPLGEYVYSITLDKKYTKVIFNNNNGEQTVDITLDDSVNGYYLTGTKTGNNYNVGTYTD